MSVYWSLEVSDGFLLASIGLPWTSTDFHGSSMSLAWVSQESSVGLPWASCGSSIGLSWVGHASFVGLPWVTHGCPLGPPWVPRGSPVGRPWIAHVKIHERPIYHEITWDEMCHMM